MTHRPFWLALAAMLVAAPALADGRFPNDLTEFDQQRLERFDSARREAIAAARAGGTPADVAELAEVLKGQAVEMAPARMAGEWRCRALKLGGRPPLVIYRDFKCRITDDEEGLRLEKLTGSQRTSGIFYDIGGARLGYAGAEAWGEEKPLRYNMDLSRDQVGYLIPLAEDRMRLELPLPLYESRFDILELRR
ncbi:DUF4893 domain-containing protein [Roseomonas marmotae]|uniref:DUF4893 domain-containing protein n=1 Tax=Roseomonas marmotae TaxID=2768161 RepID=UPI001AD6E47A|nr:DUF4893 domain-containing protein [Roseomonas marmotae]QTI78792.1 DUF4893 domain-containing protein [Roseomonas marmotae]